MTPLLAQADGPMVWIILLAVGFAIYRVRRAIKAAKDSPVMQAVVARAIRRYFR